MRRALVVAARISAALAWPADALARRGVRPLFEPTDLELEDPGVTEWDLQVGTIRGQGPWRLVIPDFEFDLGLMRNLEFDVDGAYALEAPGAGSFAFQTAAPDNLWPSFKVGVYDWADEGRTAEDLYAWALGAQIGPKIPVAPGSSGLGVETLALLGTVLWRAHFVLNAGLFADPRPSPTSGRPVGIELGLDFDRDLDKGGHYQVTAELAGVKFLSSDPNQLLATAGLAWTPIPPYTQISIVGLVGFLEGSDKYGVLLGLTQKIGIWGKPRS
jgi:hypothetical protein